MFYFSVEGKFIVSLEKWCGHNKVTLNKKKTGPRRHCRILPEPATISALSRLKAIEIQGEKECTSSMTRINYLESADIWCYQIKLFLSLISIGSLMLCFPLGRTEKMAAWIMFSNSISGVYSDDLNIISSILLGSNLFDSESRSTGLDFKNVLNEVTYKIPCLSELPARAFKALFWVPSFALVCVTIC